MLIKLLSLLFVLGVATIVITQVLIPLFRGIPFFPMFDRRRKTAIKTSAQLEEELELARVRVEQQRMEAKINEVKKAS